MMRRRVLALTVVAALLLPFGFGSEARKAGEARDATRAGGQQEALDATRAIGVAPRRFLPAVNLAQPVTTDQLIAQALAAGRITPEAALTDRVYAAFDDPRLPTQFKGDDSRVVDSHVLDELQARWAELSPAAQANLGPFLLPPVYAGSWYDLRTGGSAAAETPDASSGAAPVPLCTSLAMSKWNYMDSAVGNARVWYPKSDPAGAGAAAGYASAMATIWPKLTELMGTPLSDAGCPCGAGNGRVDMYLSGVGRSFAMSLPCPGCQASPAYINLTAGRSNSVLAHEFMHVLQWSKSMANQGFCSKEYDWLAEATAEWAMDYVYPSVQEEQATADWFLSDPGKPLETRNDAHEYGAYLLFLYLAHTQGAGVVREVWNNAAGAKSLKAVADAIGGFDAVWPQFTLKNWNEDPIKDYQTWDNLTQRPKFTSTSARLNGSPDDAFDVGPLALQHLAAKYWRIDFPDDNVRTVLFFNGLTHKVVVKDLLSDGSQGYAAEDVSDDDKKGASVKALVKIGGSWDTQDWTDRDVVGFCRDKESERIEELVLIYSNSNDDPDFMLQVRGEAPTLFMSNIGCWKWKGKSTVTMNGVSGGCGSLWKGQVDDLEWENTTGELYPVAQYQLVKGTLNWSATPPDCWCGESGGGNISLPNPTPPSAAFLATPNGIKSGGAYRAFVGRGSYAQLVPVVVGCHQVVSIPMPVGGWLLTGDLVSSRLHEDGTADGQYTSGSPLGARVWTWNLTAQRE